jgi:hypothetical protein
MLMEGISTKLDLPTSLDPAGNYRLTDMSGHGRAGWIYTHNDTRVDIRINECGNRSDGQGLKTHWADVINCIEGWPLNRR